MSTQVQVGKLIEWPEGKRDAIHVAIAPVTSSVNLRPGEHIRLVNGSTDQVETATAEHAHGIVDPFLTTWVHPGERFFMFLLPNTITSLRHDWTHPAFGQQKPDVSDRDISEAWLRDAAVKLGVDYETLIADWSPLVRGDYINNGEHIRDIWYDLRSEFWKHWEVVTGKHLPDIDEGGFTCSC